MKQLKRKGPASVKTVELLSVKIGKTIASQKQSGVVDRAEFARRFVEESRARSRALYEAKAAS